MRPELRQRVVPLCLFAIVAFSSRIDLRAEGPQASEPVAAEHDARGGDDDAAAHRSELELEQEVEREIVATDLPPIKPNRSMAELFVFSLIFFCLYLVVARKFAWLPLIDGLDARESRVNRALAEAELARIEATQLLAEHQKQLDVVTEQIKAIVTQARTDAEQEKMRIVAEAEEETAAMRDRAIAQIYAAREQALSDLDEQIESQVAIATEHVLA